jgi:hypothetical protein
MKALIKIEIFGAYGIKIEDFYSANVIGLRPLVGGALLGVAAPILFFLFSIFISADAPSIFITEREYFALRLFF